MRNKKLFRGCCLLLVLVTMCFLPALPTVAQTPFIPGSDPWDDPQLLSWPGYTEGSVSYRDVPEIRVQVDAAAEFLSYASPAGYKELGNLITKYGIVLRLVNRESAWFKSLPPVYQNSAAFVYLANGKKIPDGVRRVIFLVADPGIPVDGSGLVTNFYSAFSFWGVVDHEVKHHVPLDSWRPMMDGYFGPQRWNAEEVVSWSFHYDWVIRACPPGTIFNYYNRFKLRCMNQDAWASIVRQAGVEFNFLDKDQKELFLQAYGPWLHPHIRAHLYTLTE